MDEIIIKEKEFRNKLDELINNSGLPALILEPIARDFYEQARNLKQIQYENAEKNLKEKENKDELQQD